MVCESWGTPAIPERPVFMTHPPSCAITAQSTRDVPFLRQEKLATQGLRALEIFRGLFRGSYSPRPKLVDAGKALNLQMSWFPNNLCGRPGASLESS